MRLAMLGVLLLSSVLWGRAGICAESTEPWGWVLLQPGGSKALVREGTTQVSRSGNKFEAELIESGLSPSKLRGARRGKQLNAEVTMSHTDSGPIYFSQGRWLAHKIPGSTLETIWLHEPATGHYLIFNRWVRD